MVLFSSKVPFQWLVTTRSGQASQFRSVQESSPSQSVSTPSPGTSCSWEPG